MDKKTLRAQIKAQKAALSEEQILAASERLARQLYAHPAITVCRSRSRTAPLPGMRRRSF